MRSVCFCMRALWHNGKKMSSPHFVLDVHNMHCYGLVINGDRQMTDDILSYHVYSNGLWLQDDERSWGADFLASAAFTSSSLANGIGEREANGRTFYVMACMA